MKHDRTGIRWLALVLIALFALGSTGCSREQVAKAEQLVDRAESALVVAREQLATAHDHIDTLRGQVDKYAGLVSEIGGEKGAELVKGLRERLADAEAALPKLQNAVAMAEQGAQEARRGLSLAKSEASAGEWVKWGLGALATLLGGGAGIAVRGGMRTRAALQTAVALADEYRPLAEAHNADAAKAALRQAKYDQDRRGVRDIVRREIRPR